MRWRSDCRDLPAGVPACRSRSWSRVRSWPAAIFLDSHSEWPGFAALLPVIGAAMVVAGGKLTAKPLWAAIAVVPAAAGNRCRLLFLVSLALADFGLSELRQYRRSRARCTSMGDSPISLALPRRAIISSKHRFGSVAWSLSHRRYRTIGAAIAGIGLLAARGDNPVAPSRKRIDGLRHCLRRFEKARADHGILPVECQHSRKSFVGLSDPLRCRLGRADARRTMVVWGDSQGDHLLPLLDKIGRRHGFAVVARTRPACRPLAGEFGPVGIVVRTSRIIADCARFNAAVTEELTTLAQEGAAVVVIASRWPPDGEAGNQEIPAWEQSFARTLKRRSGSWPAGGAHRSVSGIGTECAELSGKARSENV